MIKLYQPQSPKKVYNKPFPIFIQGLSKDVVAYARLGNTETHKHNVWSKNNIASKRGIVADLCPLDLSKWSEEDD